MEHSEHSAQVAADTARLEELGYQQRLARRLHLFSNFAIGFTYLSPVVGVYGLFAYGLATGGPAFIWTIPLVLAGQLLVALVFAEVASEYPIAGGIYQWSRNLAGERYAWFAGWMYMWALLINIAAATGAATLFMGPLFGYEVTHTSTIITVAALLAAGGVINLIGVKFLSLVSRVGVTVEIIGTVVLGVIFLLGYHHNSVSVIFHNLGVAGNGGYIGAFLAACLFGVWCLYGFEACGDVAEEVVDPSSKVPKAMILSLVIGAIAAFFITFCLIIAVPDLNAVISGADENPILTVLNGALGTGGAKVALVMVLVAFLSCVLSTQASSTRLVYSFGRDKMILGGKYLARVHPVFRTPHWAVLVVFLIPSLINLLPSATISRIIAFAVVGNYIAFAAVVGASIIARSRGWQPRGKFKLGRFGWPVSIAAILYQLATIVVLSDKTPPFGSGFFNRWFVPVSAGIVFALGVIYYVIVKPKREVQDGGPGAPGIGEPVVAAGQESAL
jgi:amino acid transporter